MLDENFLYFRLLKESLVKKLQKKYPEIGNNISAWKGKEIRFFQRDLEEHVNGRISEKSFYTYFKTEIEKTPRIDILDLLCQYIGQEDWVTFKNNNQLKTKKNRYFFIGIATIVVMLGATIIFMLSKPTKYTISVVDAYTNSFLDPNQLKIVQLYDDQSPKEIVEIDDSSYALLANKSEVKFVIVAPYFHTDTILRKVSNLSQYEKISIFPNDYALLIHSLSRSNDEDWSKRRMQLSKIISDEARIIQISADGGIAVELYNKHEFINKLTIPVNSLRNIDIIYIKHVDEQISELRFTQKKGGNDD